MRCKIVFVVGLLVSASVQAEGMIDITPYVAANVAYDDNVFRFSSPERAKAAFGSSATSDVIKRIDVGVNANLRLSRQVFTLASSVNESRYDRFDILDNTATANSLGWNWHLGDDLYGELSTSESDAMMGFGEILVPVKNMRTTSRQRGSINWRFHPDWTVDASREHIKSDNELKTFKDFNREDKIFETGVRYQSPLGAMLRMAYRIMDSDFPNRTFSSLGDASTRKDIILEAAWLPTAKTKLSARISQVHVEIKNAPQLDINGVRQRWNLDHALTGKAMINFTAFKEIEPIDFVLSSFVEISGVGVNPVWNPTSKVSVRAGLLYQEREFREGTGFALTGIDRHDKSKIANVSVSYTPTSKSLLQLQYQAEDRRSNFTDFTYKFNNISLLMGYNF